MGRAYIFELYASQLLQCILNRHSVFTYYVGVVSCHLQPEGIAVYLFIDNPSIQCSKTSEGIAREKYVATERYHCLRPVYHRSKHKGQFLLTQRQRVTIVHSNKIVGYAIEALYHGEGLLVAYYLYLGIVLLYQCYGTAMVGFHVVYHKVVDRTFAYHFTYVLKILGEEIHLYRINETNLIVYDKIRIIAHSIGQWPKSLKQVLVTVVDTYIIGLVAYFYHDYWYFMLKKGHSRLLSKRKRARQLCGNVLLHRD